MKNLQNKTNWLAEIPNWNTLDLASQFPSYNSFGRPISYIQKSFGATNSLEFERMMKTFREHGFVKRSWFFFWKRSKTMEHTLKVEGYYL